MFFTIEDARAVAPKILEGSDKVEKVFLFGSTVRKGKGHDLDLILLVDDASAREWWEVSKEDILVRFPTSLLWARRLLKRLAPNVDDLLIHKKKLRRQNVTSGLLGIDLMALEKSYNENLILDVWLLSKEWFVGGEFDVESVQKIVSIDHHQRTVKFLENIVESAVEVG